MDKLPLIIYDSECTLCTRFKQGLQRLDLNKNLSFISIHSPEIRNFNIYIDINEIHETIHLIDEDKNILKGPEVIPYLAKSLPAVNKLAWLLETNIGKKASDFFYEKVNQLRKSQLEECNHCNKKKK